MYKKVFIISFLVGIFIIMFCGISKSESSETMINEIDKKTDKIKVNTSKNVHIDNILDEGIYTIKSFDNENFVLDVEGASTQQCANVLLYQNHNAANQKFRVKYVGDGYYTISALHSNRFLDVANGSKIPETNVWQIASNGTDAQKWQIKDAGDGSYYIISKLNGLYLDVYGGIAKSCVNIQVYTGHNGRGQKFIFEKRKQEMGSQSVEDGTYKIMSAEDSSKVFDIEEASTSNGAILKLWNNHNATNQKFDIVYVGDGYYKIKAKHSNKVLTIESENPEFGSMIKQQEDKNLDTQKWIIKKSSEGVFYIVSKCENFYIDLENNTASNCQNFELKYGNGSPTQRFILVNETPKKNIEQITDGIYQLSLKSNKVLDIEGASYKNVGNALIWQNNRAQNQKFQITRVGDLNEYKIISVNSAKSLDVEGGDTNLFSNLIQYDYYGQSNQTWLFKNCGDGYYNIISKSSGLCLDVSNGKIDTNGTNVQLCYQNGSDAQKFRLQPINVIENNTYEIETKLDSNEILDVDFESSNDGANIQLWNANNANNQRFIFEGLNSNTYKILAKHSNKALTVDKETSNVYQSIYVGEKNQQWEIRPAGEGYYNLISKENGLFLDVYTGKAYAGQNIWVFKSNGSDAQKFKFVTGFRKYYEEGSYGKSGLAIKNNWGETNLKYYKFGRGYKSLFLTFSIHGFEDSYNNDGAELTYIAEEFKKYLLNNVSESIVNNWKIYIFPDLNPDGQKYGWSNNGPGRTTLYSAAPGNKGIDMNRNWSVGYKQERGNRNYNGTEPFQSFEARALRDFLLGNQGEKNILVDTHGWLNETIGDYRLGGYYRNQFGLPTHIYSYGQGYLVNWARTLKNGSSTLVELPQVWNHNQTVNWNYSQKFINATMQLLREN